jgi:putative peptidoglycan lipid II flippase
MTQQSVIAYSFGLQAFMLVKMLSTGFYARQNIKTPVKIAIATMILNLIFNLALIKPLAHAGLALATSLSSWFNVLLLWGILFRSKIYRFQQGWWRFALRIVFANILVALLLWWGHGTLQQWVDWNWHQRTLHLLFWLLAACVVYLASLFITGMRAHDFRAID